MVAHLLTLLSGYASLFLHFKIFACMLHVDLKLLIHGTVLGLFSCVLYQCFLWTLQVSVDSTSSNSIGEEYELSMTDIYYLLLSDLSKFVHIFSVAEQLIFLKKLYQNQLLFNDFYCDTFLFCCQVKYRIFLKKPNVIPLKISLQSHGGLSLESKKEPRTIPAIYNPSSRREFWKPYPKILMILNP